MPFPLSSPALSLLLAAAASGDPQEHPHPEAPALDRIVVTASPLSPGSDDLVQPVEVLSGAELDRRKAATLGETVSRAPGVQSSFFGAGVGRPIIRGLAGARVQVLEGGVSAMDASTVSADHAVGIEPFLADQVEILKGPATLLYGSGAVGGAVNVVDGRVPEELPLLPLTGRAELRGNSVSDEATAMLRLDGGLGTLAWHVDAFHRDQDDYAIPGHAAREDADEHHAGGHDDHPHGGRLENSAVSSEGGAVGLSWIGDAGFVGMAVSRYASLYGIPGLEHGHGDEDGHGHGDGHGHAVRIDLEQTRVDARGAWLAPAPWLESLRVRMAHNDYGHVELEGDEVGTTFRSDGHEGRVELVHVPWAGWTGALGLQFSSRDFRAMGEEAFVPPSRSNDAGLFIVEQRRQGDWTLELGARHDRASVDPDGLDRARFDASSLSAGLRYEVNDILHVSAAFDRAERVPTAEELFSNGPHLATGGFELGDAGLDTETANQLELGAHLHVGVLEAELSVFDNRYDDFIHLVATGGTEHGLPVRQWMQGDARFRGLEAEASLQLADNDSGRWSLRLFGDRVRATLDAGGNLPRIAPARFGGELAWEREAWRASVGALRHSRQDRVAPGETPTDGYTLLDAHLTWHFDYGGMGGELFLDGTNLTDREARVHTSFLKDVAPLPGRAVAFGIRLFY